MFLVQVLVSSKFYHWNKKEKKKKTGKKMRVIYEGEGNRCPQF